MLIAAAVAVLLAGGGIGAGMLLDDDPQATEATPLSASGGGIGATRINQIYERVSSGVVNVRTGGGTGTGFVVDKDGTIVTNAHVVGDSTEVVVRFNDRADPVRAEVAGTDPSSDLAVLRVDPGDAPQLRVLTFADSDRVRVGDAAVAIGYPLGLDRTATAGIVSGLGREIEAPNGFTIEKVIQTDAPINPGNSGGPLIDARGRVIGVNSQIATAGSQGNVGIGFAVPSNTVREVVPQLKRGQRVRRPYLGVSTTVALGTTGARVGEVVAGGPAANAGVRVGDVITKVAGKPVGAPDDVSRALDGRKPGERVDVEVKRGGATSSVQVELGVRPDKVP
ncbi:MAG: trypsin-like peptidase domain-containing protein [Solirubrobacterales bacterium]|nr:trypsin-like peptidase domain-containing protein [Solirubrobacterales bacterium]